MVFSSCLFWLLGKCTKIQWYLNCIVIRPGARQYFGLGNLRLRMNY